MNKQLLLIFIFSLFFGENIGAQIRVAPDNRDHYIQTARQLFKENKWAEGKGFVDQGLAKYPKDSDLKELIGKYYFQKKDNDKARYELSKALEYNSKNVDAKQTLINVEMATERYSSAISYVNELLEILPYDKTLWIKKAEAYRMQGNVVESNRLLKRISHIYPEDQMLKETLIESLSEEFFSKKNGSQMSEITELATYIINADSQNEEVFIGLINSYLQIGNYEEALLHAERAVLDIPQSVVLIKKRNSILAHLGRYQEILTALSESKSKYGANPALQQEYNYYMEETARYSNESDPYYLYQTLFQKNPKNTGYFDKVYTTAVSRSLFDDAIEAIKLAKKEQGETKQLLLKELSLYERMDNQVKSRQLVYRINELYPEDEDVKYQKCVLHYKEAKDLMAEGSFQRAIPYFDFIEENGDEELVKLALVSKYNCFVQLRNVAKAELAINRLIELEPMEVSWRLKKSTLFGINKDYGRALQEYEAGLQLAINKGESTEWLIAGYDEQATIYAKYLIETYRLDEAIKLIDNWLAVCPESESAVRYGYNVASQMKKDEKTKKYLLHGLRYHSEESFFQLKLADIYASEKKYDAASGILLPVLAKYPYHQEAIAAYSQLSIDSTKLLLKTKKTNEGLELLNGALAYDSENNDLKYMKGVVFEKLHVLDSAAYYQSFYKPSLTELKDHQRHMRYLEFVKKKNEVSLFWHGYRFADLDNITSVAGVEYTRMGKNNTYTGRFFYSGRDNENGGMVQGEWGHIFSPNWYTVVNASVGDKVFPKAAANLTAYYGFLSTWEVELTGGFRHLADSKNMLNLQGGISKDVEFARLTAKLNSVILDEKWYYNVFGQSRFYIHDQRNYITAMGSVGSAPDIEVIDNNLYNAFDVTNVMVGVGGYFILSKACSLDATAMWYNYKTERTLRRNIYSLQLKLNIRF